MDDAYKEVIANEVKQSFMRLPRRSLLAMTTFIVVHYYNH